MSLYPDVKELIEQNEEGDVTLDEEELQKIFFGDRYNLMKQKKELEANRKRYQKSKTRYSTLNNVQNILIYRDHFITNDREGSVVVSRPTVQPNENTDFKIHEVIAFPTALTETQMFEIYDKILA